ncbi:MAG: hypothetical protein K2G19_08365, partial [Lachnospiraceae bacterium]|nr:hypothetical protein [Lachnospiraceae bacterium]
DMTNVPMRVYKEARRKGDTATMKRAMGYVNEFEDKAGEYKKKAEEGMKKDAEEAAKKEKAQREEMVEKRREEKRQMEEKLAADRQENTAQNAEAKYAKVQSTGEDTVQISGQGKALSENQIQGQHMSECPVTGQNGTGEAYMDRKPVTYTKTGETVSQSQEGSISVSV